jgi:acyl-coenzyme A synthetase/AMP-(fatty) acid ligase
VVSDNEKGQRRELSWPELRRQVASLALHLQAQGVMPGDRVAAYLPNIPETMVAFLAVVSIGGVWSVCAPDMGTHAVLDRFRQIEPVALIACDGVSYGGKDHDRLAVVAELRAALPTWRRNRPRWTARWRWPSLVQLSAPPPRATMRRWPPSNRSGCPLTTRCGSSTAAAPQGCPSPSCTATAAR